MNSLYIFILSVSIPIFSLSQRNFVGIYSGFSIGNNPIYSHNAENTSLDNLINFNYNHDLSFFENISIMDDNDYSNFELFNGVVFGIQANLPIISGVSIQPEIEYEQLDFNQQICLV